MFLRRSTQFVSRLSHTHHRWYATASTGVTQKQKKAEIFPEIKRVLKPSVIKVLEDKGDELLIKKLNFIGPEGACRLNCASRLVMDILAEDNCFRILRDEVMDNWDYYWNHICGNGSDPAKWLASLKEAQDLPYVLDKCWNRMQHAGVNPDVEHYAAYADGMGKWGIGPQAGMWCVDLKKQNYARRGADLSSTRPGRLRAWSRFVSKEIPLIFYDLCKENPTTIPSDLEEHFKKLEKEDESVIGEYYFSTKKDKVKPQLLLDREKEYNDFASRWMQQDMIDKYLQPPLEKLYNVEDKQRDDHEASKKSSEAKKQ